MDVVQRTCPPAMSSADVASALDTAALQNGAKWAADSPLHRPLGKPEGKTAVAAAERSDAKQPAGL